MAQLVNLFRRLQDGIRTKPVTRARAGSFTPHLEENSEWASVLIQYRASQSYAGQVGVPKSLVPMYCDITIDRREDNRMPSALSAGQFRERASGIPGRVMCVIKGTTRGLRCAIRIGHAGRSFCLESRAHAGESADRP
jgi:hypothetical protein